MRLWPSSSKSRPLVGVDISASAVKMLELADVGGGRLRVERYASVPLPYDAMGEGTIAKPEVVAGAMRSAWRALDTRTRSVALALPASAVTAKRLVFPKDASETDIETQATEEAGRMVPFPMEDVTLDFQVLGPSERDPHENEVLVVVTRKDRVEERAAVAEAAGLKAAIMDVDAYATLRAFEQLSSQLPNNGRNQVVGIVDIGAVTTHINVLYDNTPVFQREHPFGGQNLAQEAARRFDLSPGEVEEARRTGRLPKTYESEVLRPFMDAIALEIRRQLQLFFSSTPYYKVDCILLAGGCATIPGLDDVVCNNLQVRTLVANPFARMAVSSRVKASQLAADSPALFVACGLALRRFDPA